MVMVLLPASRPLARQLLTAMMLRLQATRRNFAAQIKAAPAPKLTTHLRESIMLNLFKVLDRKREREKATCAAIFFSALSSNKSGDGSACSYYSCLSDTDSMDSACLSATPASTDLSVPPPSSSFWSCFAPATATCYATIDCDKKKSAALNSGALVDITSERHRTGQLTDSPEMVQGILGTTHAWPTRVQWHTKTDCGVPHLLQTEAGFEDFNQLYKSNAPDQILSLSQLVEAGYGDMPYFLPSARKAGSLPRARNRSPCCRLTACGRCLLGKIRHTLGCCAQAPQ